MTRQTQQERVGVAADRALDALCRLREWRLNEARLNLECCGREVRAAQARVHAARAVLAGALDWSVRSAGLAPALHGTTLRHLGGLSADAQLAAADLDRRNDAANESRRRLELRSRELDVLHRACERTAVARRACRERAAFDQADSAWLAMRLSAVGK